MQAFDNSHYFSVSNRYVEKELIGLKIVLLKKSNLKIYGVVYRKETLLNIITSMFAYNLVQCVLDNSTSALLAILTIGRSPQALLS